MRARVVNSHDSHGYGAALDEAAAALRDGALVVFPTETVYGVGANANHAEAMRRLRELKDRTDRQPFTVHLPRRGDAGRYIGQPSPLARRLARKAWPGPLTLVCKSPDPTAEAVAGEVSSEALSEIFDGTKVGLRCPAHPAAERLLAAAGVPVVASSANPRGKPPPTEFSAALRSIGEQVDFAIDAGPTRLNSASTVVEIADDRWNILRKGAIDERVLERMAVTEILMVCTGNSCRSPLAEYLFRHRLAGRLGVKPAKLAEMGYRVQSAGTAAWPGGPISDGSHDELARRGIDASEHRAQPLTVELAARAERIYVMAEHHRSAVTDLAPAITDNVELLDPEGSIADPIGGGAEEYKRCAEHIERAVAARVEEFANEDRGW